MGASASASRRGSVVGYPGGYGTGVRQGQVQQHRGSVQHQQVGDVTVMYPRPHSATAARRTSSRASSRASSRPLAHTDPAGLPPNPRHDVSSVSPTNQPDVHIYSPYQQQGQPSSTTNQQNLGQQYVGQQNVGQQNLGHQNLGQENESLMHDDSKMSPSHHRPSSSSSSFLSSSSSSSSPSHQPFISKHPAPPPSPRHPASSAPAVPGQCYPSAMDPAYPPGHQQQQPVLGGANPAYYPAPAQHPSVPQQLQQQYPPQAGPPPPIGFRMEVIAPPAPVDMSKWDEHRDRIFMMVLSAEEFIYQMSETDARIALFSQAEEREMHQAQIQEMLGIRGHLQDELLRIHDMLAEDTEPELECLHLFLPTHPHVVHRLWELKEKQKELRARSTQVNLDLPQQKRATQQKIAQLANKVMTAAKMLGSPKKDAGTGTDGARTGKNGTGTIGTGTDGTGTDGIGTGTDGTGMERKDEEIDENIEIEINEDDLRQEHVKEEQEVAQKYTEKIVGNRGKVSQEELDRLLNAHALSMQALRDRQKGEKAKMDEILQYKRQERLLKRRAEKQEAETRSSSSATAGTSSSKDSGINEEGRRSQGDGQETGKRNGENEMRKRDSGEGDEDDDFNSDSELSSYSYEDDFEDLSANEEEEKENFKTTIEADLWEKRKGQVSEEEFMSLLQNLRQQEDQRKEMKNAEKTKHKEGILSKLAQRKKAEKAGEDNSNGDEDEDEEAYKESADELLKKLRGKMGSISDEEFAELLKQHMEDTERIRRQRQSDKDRLKEKLQKKLQGRKKGEDGGDEDDEAEEENDDGTADEQTEQQVAELESAFQKRMMLRRHELTEEELHALLEEHRQQKEKLRAQRATNKSNHQDKLNDMLAEKKRRKLKTSEKKQSSLDEQFFSDLQARQQNGELSKEEFSELLQAYMNKMGEAKKEDRQRRKAKLKQQSDSKIRENVSTLVQKHQEETRHLNDLRQREKSIMDQRLQSKLAAKKNRKIEEEKEEEGSQAPPPRRQIMCPDI